MNMTASEALWGLSYQKKKKEKKPELLSDIRHVALW